MRPAIGARFSLLDLLGRIPDLREHFEDALQKSAHCHSGRVYMLMGTLNIALYRRGADVPDINELRQSLGLSENAPSVTASDAGVTFTMKDFGGLSLHDALPTMFTSRADEHCLVERFTGGWSLSELTSYFAASHVLSMLVRYYRSRWASLVNHEKGDRLFPVLERMRNLIQKEFVPLAMWSLGAQAM